jgi:hypothetical protein
VVRNEEKLKADKMTDTLRSRDFWTEIQRMQRKHTSTTTEMDGERGEDAIRELFVGKYEELYNSVPYDREEMGDILTTLNSRVNEQCKQGKCYDDHKVSVGDVHKAIRSLKHSKSDANNLLSSDHFKNACNELHWHISLLLQLLLNHSFAPMTMLTSVLIPIPKNRKKSLSESNNYRSIALSSIIGKIWDKIILSKHSSILSSVDMQFGFRPGHSTTQCTFALQEIAEHFASRNSNVHITLLDASKAFDRVHYAKIFSLLLKRNLCPLTTKLLLMMYTTQRMSVRWRGVDSESFSCANGVKQGAVLSPVLFCVYMEELLKKLEESEIGCYIGHRYAGALCYADDVALIAPSQQAMRRMLHICEDFATKFHVKFNSSKSINIVVGTEKYTPVSLHGIIIPRATKAVHLGHAIGINAHNDNIAKAKAEFCGKINMLLSHFSFCTLDVKRHLFRTYCTSYYGCPLWDLRSLNGFSAFWRKCIRRLLKLPPRTHSRFVAPLLKIPDLKTQLLLRFVNFLSSCFNSTNNLLKACSSLTLNSHSTVANNLRCVMSILKIDYAYLLKSVSENHNSLKDSLKIELQTPFDINVHVHTIEELIGIKNNELQAPITNVEASILLNSICIE